MATTKKRKIAEVSNNARIDSFYKPISKEVLKKKFVSIDENANTESKRQSPSPTNSQQQQTKKGVKTFGNSARKVFGDSSNKKPFGDSSNKILEQPLKAKSFGEQNQLVSKFVRQPLKEKSSTQTLKSDLVIKHSNVPAFEVLRDPDVSTNNKELNTQFITESDTQYTNLTSSPLDVYRDNNEDKKRERSTSPLEIYHDSEVQSPLVIYNDERNNSQDSPLIIYKDINSNQGSPLTIYKDENNNHDSPLVIYNDENDGGDSPLLIYQDETDKGDSPLVIYQDETDNRDSPLVIYKDEADSHDSPLAIYKDENDDCDSPLEIYKDDDHDSPLVIYKDQDDDRTPLAVKDNTGEKDLYGEEEEEEELPLIIYRDESNIETQKELNLDETEEDSLAKLISLNTQDEKKKTTTPKEIKRSSKSYLSDNYDELGTTIDSSNGFFDEEEEDQHDYADVVDLFNDDFSVQNTFSQESIESTPTVTKSPLPPPISVLGSKTFFSKYGLKK